MLKQPNIAAAQHSLALIDQLKIKLVDNNNYISFQDYMNFVLYEPGLGYYMAGSNKIGASGDFVTAPEISPLFAKCLSHKFQQNLTLFNSSNTILEFGAGLGSLAAGILQHLASINCLPDNYLILELSPDLQQQQRKTLQKLCPELMNKITWLNKLPEKPIDGIIFGNEVLDALPVERFLIKNSEIYQLGMGLEQDKLCWKIKKASTKLEQAVLDIAQNCGEFSEGYRSEINLNLPTWINSVANCLANGLMLWIDYGYEQDQYYHPSRNKGSLMCYYQHNAHTDPFVYPGLQDITAHVDFTRVHTSAKASGLELLEYTSQAEFLINNNLREFAINATDKLSTQQQVRQLTLPQHMGQQFKVISFSKS